VPASPDGAAFGHTFAPKSAPRPSSERRRTIDAAAAIVVVKR
jgi:hypothetical protein